MIDRDEPSDEAGKQSAHSIDLRFAALWLLVIAVLAGLLRWSGDSWWLALGVAVFGIVVVAFTGFIDGD